MGAIDRRKRVAHDRWRGYAERGYCPRCLPFQFFDHTGYWFALGRAQIVKAPGGLLQLGIEAADAQPDQRCFHSVDSAAFSMPAKPNCTGTLCGDGRVGTG
jgi:hypothetical protein